MQVGNALRAFKSSALRLFNSSCLIPYLANKRGCQSGGAADTAWTMVSAKPACLKPEMDSGRERHGHNEDRLICACHQGDRLTGS